MEIAGYTAAILIGVSLGLIGGGGSALAVPVLVYLFHIPAQKAVPESLFIVGIASFTGAVSYMYKRLVCIKSILIFGLPSIVTVFFTRTRLSPAIPEHLQFTETLIISKDVFLLLIFATLMLAASFSMIRPMNLTEPEAGKNKDKGYPYLQIMLGGCCVGFLAGLVGAGGGFLIIPALVVLAKLPMKRAIGTSLMIIAINSSIGFISDIRNPEPVNWPFLILFSSLSILGIFAGMYLSNFVSSPKLKPAFGWFILAIGAFIISQQLFLGH